MKRIVVLLVMFLIFQVSAIDTSNFFLKVVNNVWKLTYDLFIACDDDFFVDICSRGDLVKKILQFKQKYSSLSDSLLKLNFIYGTNFEFLINSEFENYTPYNTTYIRKVSLAFDKKKPLFEEKLNKKVGKFYKDLENLIEYLKKNKALLMREIFEYRNDEAVKLFFALMRDYGKKR